MILNRRYNPTGSPPPTCISASKNPVDLKKYRNFSDKLKI
jgi:hypothetical protein